MPPYKDPRYSRGISREQSGPFYGPSVFFKKCKGAAAVAEDGVWLKLRNHPKTRRSPASQQSNVAASVLLHDHQWGSGMAGKHRLGLKAGRRLPVLRENFTFLAAFSFPRDAVKGICHRKENSWRIPPDSKKLQPENSHLCVCKQSQHISSLGSIQAALYSKAVPFLLPDAVHPSFSAFHLSWLSPENFQRGNFLLLWRLVNVVLGGK